MSASEPNSVHEARLKQWKPMVAGIARSFRGALSKWYDLDELIAIGMVAAWRASLAYDPEHEQQAQFQTFARRYVINSFMAYRHYTRAAKRRDYVRSFSVDVANEQGEALFILPSLLPNAEAELADRQTVSLVTRALDQLTLQERDALTQRMNGKSLAEISEEWGRSRERVRQVERKAMLKLQGELGRTFELKRTGKKPISLKRAGVTATAVRARRKVAAKEPVT